MRGDQATTLANTTLAGGWLGPRAPGNLVPAPASAKDSLYSWRGHCAEIRCTPSLEVATAQLEQLLGPGGGGEARP